MRDDMLGQKVLVTGASRGLGRAMALGLAGAGAELVLTARDEAALARVADEARSVGVRTHVVPGDLGTAEGAAEVARRAIDLAGGYLDVLVNNAGMSDPKPFVETDDTTWSRLLEVNLLAAVRLTRAVAPTMLARSSGRVIMVGSALGSTVVPGNASYVVTKAAIEHLARALAVEWARKGIRVNCLAPGFFATEIVEDVQREGPLRDYVLRRTPMRRLGVPEELVEAVLLLASPRATFLTGETLHVDGGWLAS